MQHNAARRLKRDEVGEERAVEEIDADGARENIEPAGAVIGGEYVLAPRIAMARERLGDAVGKRRRVPQSKIESLRSDRRQDVAGFADEGNAPRGEGLRGQAGDREERARTDALDAAEKSVEPVGERCRETFRIESHELSDVRRRADQDQGGAARIGKGHRGQRSALAVKLDGDAFMRARVTKARGDRALIVAPFAHLDSGGIPAQRAPSVRGHDEAR